MSNSDVKQFLRFIIGLLLSAIGAFFLQTRILQYKQLDPFAHLIVPAYLFNFGLALGIVLLLYLLKRKLKDQIGFLFILGSFIKFALFFLFFHPIYNQDNIIQTSEFTAFFIPYLIALLVETIAVAKLLKGVDNQLN